MNSTSGDEREGGDQDHEAEVPQLGRGHGSSRGQGENEFSWEYLNAYEIFSQMSHKIMETGENQEKFRWLFAKNLWVANYLATSLTIFYFV